MHPPSTRDRHCPGCTGRRRQQADQILFSINRWPAQRRRYLAVTVCAQQPRRAANAVRRVLYLRAPDCDQFC